MTLTKKFLVGGVLQNSVTFAGVPYPPPADRDVNVVFQVCNSGQGYQGAVTILDTGSTTGIPFWGSEEFRPGGVTKGFGAPDANGWNYDWPGDS